MQRSLREKDQGMLEANGYARMLKVMSALVLSKLQEEEEEDEDDDEDEENLMLLKAMEKNQRKGRRESRSFLFYSLNK